MQAWLLVPYSLKSWLGGEKQQTHDIGNVSEEKFKQAYNHLKEAVQNLWDRRLISREYTGLLHLFLAVMFKESSFDYAASARAQQTNEITVGYFQLNPRATQDVGYSPNDRRDPVKNCEMGVLYIQKNQQQCTAEFSVDFVEGLKFAVMSHNMGYAAVKRLKELWGVPSVNDFLNALQRQINRGDLSFEYEGWTNGRRAMKQAVLTTQKIRIVIDYYTKVYDFGKKAKDLMKKYGVN